MDQEHIAYLPVGRAQGLEQSDLLSFLDAKNDQRTGDPKCRHNHNKEHQKLRHHFLHLHLRQQHGVQVFPCTDVKTGTEFLLQAGLDWLEVERLIGLRPNHVRHIIIHVVEILRVPDIAKNKIIQLTLSRIKDAFHRVFLGQNPKCLTFILCVFHFLEALRRIDQHGVADVQPERSVRPTKIPSHHQTISRQIEFTQNRGFRNLADFAHALLVHPDQFRRIKGGLHAFPLGFEHHLTHHNRHGTGDAIHRFHLLG